MQIRMVTGSRTSEIVLATELNKDKLKKMRCSLIDIFHRKRWGSDASDVQLYQLLETMFNANLATSIKCGSKIHDQLRQPGPLHHRKHLPEEVEPLPANNRMQLTQLVHDREVIWNRSHPDHPVLAKRDEAFDEVTRELGMSMPELKHHWRTHGGKMDTKINNQSWPSSRTR
ncbi:uncharacterized protein LOC120414839 [Culex pipiens pallens]|uniref:uncharacterized protein LOC120414839 n=1 Tax=Culex pipiens pallens TaxID=42434 RepID=UPI0022AA00AA|nr:uncharacterized protein LOC120414839 [Culex pipiens pallens]